MKTIAHANATLGATPYTTHVSASGFEFICDEPEDMGGHNQGPNPYDYLLAGLGSCTIITLRMYAQRKGWEVGELHIALSAKKDDQQHTHIQRTLSASEPLSAEQWARLLDIADKTPVTRTLLQGARITTEHR